MKIAIVQFPGSNCERETILAVKRAGMYPIECLWNHAPETLRDMDGFIIVGGFSYEDRSRAGIIAALDPIMQEIKIQSELGKPILGICNGAQILVETGLVPGLKDYQSAIALSENKRIVDGTLLGTGFYNHWITIRSCISKPNAFTKRLAPETLLTIPTAHAQGRFTMPAELLEEMEQEQLLAFQYCDTQGDIINNFPVNPNGSVLNCAAIINKSGNVMAMMPHPERSTAGDLIFLSMKDYIQESIPFHLEQLSYEPHPIPRLLYRKPDNSYECIVQLIITDNHALTVQNTLQQLGIIVTVTRMIHWQIDTDVPEILNQISQTDILYNERKEFLIDPQSILSSKKYLIRPIDDLIGQQKKQLLDEHGEVSKINQISHGILWCFDGEKTMMDKLTDTLLNTHILFNSNSHRCYEYENT